MNFIDVEKVSKVFFDFNSESWKCYINALEILQKLLSDSSIEQFMCEISSSLDNIRKFILYLSDEIVSFTRSIRNRKIDSEITSSQYKSLHSKIRTLYELLCILTPFIDINTVYFHSKIADIVKDHVRLAWCLRTIPRFVLKQLLATEHEGVIDWYVNFLGYEVIPLPSEAADHDWYILRPRNFRDTRSEGQIGTATLSKRVYSFTRRILCSFNESSIIGYMTGLSILSLMFVLLFNLDIAALSLRFINGDRQYIVKDLRELLNNIIKNIVSKHYDVQHLRSLSRSYPEIETILFLENTSEGDSIGIKFENISAILKISKRIPKVFEWLCDENNLPWITDVTGTGAKNYYSKSTLTYYDLINKVVGEGLLPYFEILVDNSQKGNIYFVCVPWANIRIQLHDMPTR